MTKPTDIIKLCFRRLFFSTCTFNFRSFKNKFLGVFLLSTFNDGISVFRKFYPNYNDNIQFGKNTISSPSVLAIKRENYISFDEELIYLMDVDLYKRYFDRDGYHILLMIFWLLIDYILSKLVK